MRIPFPSALAALALAVLPSLATARPFNPDFRRDDDAAVAVQPAAGDYVVLLHGMARSKASLGRLADTLHDAGFFTIAIDYPGLHADLHTVGDASVAPVVAELCTDPTRRTHFVGHSLGNLVVRTFLAGPHRPANLGRVVMLAPPNNGSTIIDALGDNPIVTALLGPVCDQLRTDDGSVVRRLPDPDYPAGVIMGNRPVIPFFRRILDEENDGIVPVAGGRLGGLDDFLVVHRGHTMIMNAPEVTRQILAFLEHGAFAAGAPALR